MRKDVDIVINQVPTSVTFICPHCENEADIEYNEFEHITGNDLCGLLYASTYFECPNCGGELETDGVELG